ncbi:Uncharacterized conserved protein [Bergeriella denitrificans]|uniref:Uncharacterized conserved protein n=2 Tax=Bergeriella denitrificans TaxID=494 RepID=A0A378UGE3_BERDE|nr:Uncharacterized conserved protein [Bergeriella denitrificans]
MEEYDTELAELVRGWLDREAYHYDFNAEKGLFRYGLSVKGKLNKLDCAVSIGSDNLIFYAIAPLKAEPERLGEAAEFIARANYGLIHGCFELDFSDGEIRYRITVNCDGVQPSEAVLDDSFGIPAGMFERYGQGLLEVLFGFETPAAAVAKCEQAAAGAAPSVPPTRH